MFEFIKAFMGQYLPEREEEGQGLVEYALIVVLISIAAIVIMGTLGGTISDIFGQANDALSGAD